MTNRINNILEPKTNKKSYSVILLILGCFLLAACSFAGKSDDNSPKDSTSHDFATDITNISDDPIGATIPGILFADDTYCIFYDYHGVFKYDMNEALFVDYLSFDSLGFSSHTQGADATFVYAANKGNTIFITNGSKLYEYDCATHKGEFADNSSDKLSDTILEEISIYDGTIDSAVGSIVLTDTNCKVYFTISGEAPTYKDIHLNKDSYGNVTAYELFKN